MQCESLTQAGTRCKRSCEFGKRLCKQHSGGEGGASGAKRVGAPMANKQPWTDADMEAYAQSYDDAINDFYADMDKTDQSVHRRKSATKRSVRSISGGGRGVMNARRHTRPSPKRRRRS